MLTLIATGVAALVVIARMAPRAEPALMLDLTPMLKARR